MRVKGNDSEGYIPKGTVVGILFLRYSSIWQVLMACE